MRAWREVLGHARQGQPLPFGAVVPEHDGVEAAVVFANEPVGPFGFLPHPFAEPLLQQLRLLLGRCGFGGVQDPALVVAFVSDTHGPLFEDLLEDVRGGHPLGAPVARGREGVTVGLDVPHRTGCVRDGGVGVVEDFADELLMGFGVDPDSAKAGFHFVHAQRFRNGLGEGVNVGFEPFVSERGGLGDFELFAHVSGEVFGSGLEGFVRAGDLVDALPHGRARFLAADAQQRGGVVQVNFAHGIEGDGEGFFGGVDAEDGSAGLDLAAGEQSSRGGGLGGFVEVLQCLDQGPERVTAKDGDGSGVWCGPGWAPASLHPLVRCPGA